ncbi:transglycosylase SLT domain-containing protein [Microvirga sp. G4-2]|uniref:transglycosylase SLT domain-containing protein n=1 Tax=Microvirga sp. G4-2 TaxID=3434467 RepID=UPI004044A60A
MSNPPGRSSFLPIILREAEANDLPPAIIDAVIRVESFYNPAAIGTVGEIGLMQVRPSTAAMIGFRGTIADLANPETNIRYGVRYLARAWRLAKGDLCLALMKYRAGHGAEQMSALSTEYCRRARRHLATAWPGFAANVTPDALIASDSDPAPSESPSSKSIALMPPDPSKGSGAKVAATRSAQWLIAIGRAQSAAAWRRVSAKSRSQALWAAHAARKVTIGKQPPSSL